MTGHRFARTIPRIERLLARWKYEPDTQQCFATNWVNRTQCTNPTHYVCLECGKRTCGTHAHWHKGNPGSMYAHRTGCQAQFLQ